MSHVNVLEKYQKSVAVERPDIPLFGAARAATPSPVPEIPPLPPVLTPPVEIIARIFELGAEDDHARFPVLVSHVCSRLRDVALSIPMLWTTIHFAGNKSPDHKDYHEVIQRLQRSKNVPIDLTVSQIQCLADADNLVYLLAPHVRRLKTASMDLWDPSSAEFITQRLTQHAPLLQSLSLQGFCPTVFNPFSGVAPKLKTLSVKGVHLDWESDIFANLEELYLHAPLWSSGALLDRFSGRPLKTLTIRSDPLSPLVITFATQHILLPELDTLELNGVTEEDIVRMLSHVEMPKLRRLLFTHIKDSPHPVPTTIHPLPCVEQLRLHATEMCQDNLLNVLRKVRNLTSISFEDSSPIPTFIHELTPIAADTDTWLIPNITSFKVVAFEKDNAHRVYDDTDIADALSRMMWKRMRFGGKQMSIRMCVFQGERDDVTRHAAEWDEERRYKSERRINLNDY